MKKAILKLAFLYLMWLVLFALLKLVFMAVYISAPASDWWQVVSHGATMDRSVAAYLTVIPGLIVFAQLLTKAKWARVALNVYMAVIALLISLIYCIDLGLYGYWGFRLDMTPIFYFTTSPSAAMASVEWWQWIVGLLGIVAIAAAIWVVYRFIDRRTPVEPIRGKKQWWQSAVIFLLTALLFLPIRGGVTVGTMNPSAVYFSENQQLNHAALNPAFSLLYSITHQTDFDDQFRLMDNDEASVELAKLLFTDGQWPATATCRRDTSAPADYPVDSVAAEMLTTDRPDIVMVILESFSSFLLPVQGGEPVAVGLDSLARDGVLFTNFYASSFRTDRALSAILASQPVPPTTSLLKYVDKFENLPGLATVLADNGYNCSYYYGGDTKFVNMQAFLVSQGFDPIINDQSFSASDRTWKWGVHDEKVFERVLSDISARSRAGASGNGGAPTLTVVQTSSSHEPFEPPYENPRFADNKILNAFAYTDSCLTNFVNGLRKLPGWEKRLVVIVPDHWGVYPLPLEDYVARHHIPLVLQGGALARRGYTIDRLGTQTDIAATLLAMMKIAPTGLKYSRDILSPATREVALYTDANLVGIITPTDTLIYNTDALAPQNARGRQPDALVRPAQAFLRELYHTIGQMPQ